jgi:hypothetical protein
MDVLAVRRQPMNQRNLSRDAGVDRIQDLDSALFILLDSTIE